MDQVSGEMQKVVYVNRSCQPVIAECLGSFPMDVVGLVVEYLPPKGRQFFYERKEGRCRMCMLMGHGLRINIKLPIQPEYKLDVFDVFMCDGCQAGSTIEDVYTRGFMSFSQSYFATQNHMCASFIQLVHPTRFGFDAMLRMDVYYKLDSPGRFKVELINEPWQWFVSDNVQEDVKSIASAVRVSGRIPDFIRVPDGFLH